MPKKATQGAYNKLSKSKKKGEPSIVTDQLKQVLTQQFFFHDATREFYDFSKVQFYNLLYTDGDESEKIGYLYRMMQSSQTNVLTKNSSKLIKSIEYLTQITTWVMSEACIRNMTDVYQNSNDMHCFEDLHKLMTTNPCMTRDFAHYIIEEVLFRTKDDGRLAKLTQLSRKDFKNKMAEEGKFQYILVRPAKLRKLFAEYCIVNKEQALDGAFSMM